MTDKHNLREVRAIHSVEQFYESDETLESFQTKFPYFNTRAEGEDALREVVALTTDGFMVKRQNEWCGYTYEQKSFDELKKLFFAYIEVKDNEHSKKTKRWYPWQSLGDGDFHRRMARFTSISLMSERSGVLSLFKPPMLVSDDEYQPERVKTLISFLESRVLDPKALHEELSTHAYRFRHPDARFAKVFIHYATTGGTGKTFLMNLFGMLYQGFCFTGKEADAKDRFNSWMGQTLLVGFEELENDNFRNKWFETFIKQSTSTSGSVRAMYRETTGTTQFRFILMLNTNQPDLYGMVRADDALKSRLVIVPFKEERLPESEWVRVLASVGLRNPLSDYCEEHRTFAGSFYRYLLEDYENPFVPMSQYSPQRYFSPEKDAFLLKALEAANSTPSSFFLDLVKMPKDPYSGGWAGWNPRNPTAVLRVRTGSRGEYKGKTYYYCWVREFEAAFRTYQGDSAHKFSVATVKKMLCDIDLGDGVKWSAQTIDNQRCLSVEKQHWDKWRAENLPPALEGGEEGEEGEEEA